MFFKKPSVSRAALVALTGAATLVAAGPAQAACKATTTKKAFAMFGDTADYSLAPGGNFESGTTGWSLGGASVVKGNEPFFLGSRTDAKSLSVPSTARVVSPSFCVGIEHPSFRLVARRTSGTWGVLYVKLRWSEAGGRVNETVVGALSGGQYAAWTPSPSYNLSQVLAIWNSGQSVNAQIVVQPESGGGNWQIDDLYIDPYRRS